MSSRPLACSFKRSCSILKSRDELAAEQDNTANNTGDNTENNTGDNTENITEDNTENNTDDNTEQNTEESQQEEAVETDSVQENFTGSEIQGDQSSQCSSFTEEEKAVSKERVMLQETVVSANTAAAYQQFQYKPACVPERNRFQAGITFVDSQGYIYAQEVKEGEVLL